MPYTERKDVPGLIAAAIPAPYRLVVHDEMQPDMGYFAELFRGDEELHRFELYPYVVVGPGPNRPIDERRVQLELGRRAENIIRDPPEGRTGIMLGLRDRDIDGSEASLLIVAFSFGIYREMTTRSSLQFPKRILLEAEMLGASASSKVSRRMGPPIRAITLAFRPEVLPLFLIEFAGHFTQTAPWEPLAIAQFQDTAQRYFKVDPAVQNEALNPPGHTFFDPVATPIGELRRVVARAIMRPIRHWRFATDVQRAYGYRCAVCDIQLDLVEAAHIDPASNVTSTDEITNGIALCALHHLAYDQGLLDLQADGTISIVQSKIDELREALHDGGLDAFRANLRPRLRLPEDRRHWPMREHFEKRAAYLRGQRAE